MRGIVGWGVHLPHRRLDRAQIPGFVGVGGGKGSRTVASYDEDTTTMAVEAGRAALRDTSFRPRAMWLATASPAYLDKTNATAVHAALRLDRDAAAYDAIGSMRSAMGALTAALTANGPAMAIASDIRVGLPGGPEETSGGDAAAALLLGDDSDAPVLAELVAKSSLTEEFLDRWRVLGEPASRTWEERFGETKYVPLALEALKAALGEAKLDVADVDLLVVAGLHERACAAVEKKSGVARGIAADRLALTVGNPGAAQPYLLLAGALEQAEPGQVIVLLTLADGADALVLRTTDAIAAHRVSVPVKAQASALGAPVAYGRYLAWRGILPLEPPRRPEPTRPSASAAGRNTDWKFGLQNDGAAVADQVGTVSAFTIDKLAYSPSPPVVFAVVDFDDGTRLPVELTDVDAEEVEVGMRVRMTFRRLWTADGIANYFWKARPIPTGTIRTAM